MKLLLIFSVIFATSSLVVAQECTSATKQVTCVDCQWFLLCPSASPISMTYICPPSARYCVPSNIATRNDDCSFTPPSGCQPDPFQCTSTGFMPSPLDCSAFYYCQPIRDANGTLISIENNPTRCVAPTPIFNPDAVNQCEGQTTLNSNNCGTIVCPPPTDLTPFSLTARVRNLRKHYYRCFAGEVKIYQCPENKDYDEQRTGLPDPCSYSCRTLYQTYVDQNNGTIYYECLCTGLLTTCQPTVRNCQRYYVYSEELKRCILPMSAPLEIDLEDQAE